MEAAVVDQRKEQFPHAVALGTEPQFQLKVNPFGLRLLRDHFKGGELFDGVWCHQLAKLHKGQESLGEEGGFWLELTFLSIPLQKSSAVHCREPLHFDDRLLLFLDCPLHARVHLQQHGLKQDDPEWAAYFLRLLLAQVAPLRRHSIQVRQERLLTASQIRV